MNSRVESMFAAFRKMSHLCGAVGGWELDIIGEYKGSINSFQGPLKCGFKANGAKYSIWLVYMWALRIKFSHYLLDIFLVRK